MTEKNERLLEEARQQSGFEPTFVCMFVTNGNEWEFIAEGDITTTGLEHMFKRVLQETFSKGRASLELGKPLQGNTAGTIQGYSLKPSKESR